MKNQPFSWKFDRFDPDSADSDAAYAASKGYADMMSSGEEVCAFYAGFYRGARWMQCKLLKWNRLPECQPELLPSGVCAKYLLVAFKVPGAPYSGLATISQPRMENGRLIWPFDGGTLEYWGYEAVAWMEINTLVYREEQDGHTP